MEQEFIEKQNYQKKYGLQELLWSKGNDPIVTLESYIQTNLIEIEDFDFLYGIAERYGVNLEDLFPTYLTTVDENGNNIKQSRVLLRQIQNRETGEKKYRFVIKGDNGKEDFYPLDGFEETEESVVEAQEGNSRDVEVLGNLYKIRSTVIDRYTQKKYTVLEGQREDLQIAEELENSEQELLNTRIYIEKESEEQRGEEYYSADFEYSLKEEEKEPIKEGLGEKIRRLVQKIFGKRKPKQLPEPKKSNQLGKYQLENPEEYNLSSEEISKTAQKRLLDDLKKERE